MPQRLAFFNTQGKTEFIPYDFDISLGTNWHGELAYADFIDEDVFSTKNLAAQFGSGPARPLVDKVLAVAKYREQYVSYLKDYLQPAGKLFLFSEYRKPVSGWCQSHCGCLRAARPPPQLDLLEGREPSDGFYPTHRAQTGRHHRGRADQGRGLPSRGASDGNHACFPLGHRARAQG